ncbi:hypothetical protein [Adhaeribacter radiodurans]|uniref:Uncharacterized protein n=1 Tax=Adhaeribacter radiodurans TaxID=2745197 RepID=A0A7L7LBB9_9BACT|nr:hypothetical protein [Adhaeribacter radiodurans]QMU30132.1 hypothetical protein HUW48_19800 [Adhaeribacter radiodurans]
MLDHTYTSNKSLFGQDKDTKINHFLSALPHLIFSETGLKNIAGRFGITLEELKAHIAEFEKENTWKGGQNG